MIQMHPGCEYQYYTSPDYYECCHCGYRNPHFNRLVKHQCAYGRYHCSYCDRNFKDSPTATEHVNQFHYVSPMDFALENNPADLTPVAPPPDDPWAHRSSTMRCATCMWFVGKKPSKTLGRCRRHAPVLQGYPVVTTEDWCGDHKLNEKEVG